jgi:hypothetical protein
MRKSKAQIERDRAVGLVMDLFWALKTIHGQPNLKDLVKLAKRIKHDAKTNGYSSDKRSA